MYVRLIKWLLLCATAVLSLLAGVVTPVAAETTQCTAITKTPTVISRPGHYCLKQDLRFAPLTGIAIDVRAGNVVIDMNGYYLRGDTSTSNMSVGIMVRNKPNVRVANGVLTHFRKGLFAVASSGLLVENMNVLNAKEAAIMFERTKASIIRDSRFLNNLVTADGSVNTAVIFTSNSTGTRIINNDISNTGNTIGQGDTAVGVGVAIYVQFASGAVLIENNRITASTRAAIVVFDEYFATVQRNTIINTLGWGVLTGSGTALVRDNTFVNTEKGSVVGDNVVNGGGNVSAGG